MTPHQAIGVAVRLFAVWLLITALQTIFTGIALNLRPDAEDTIVAYLFAALYVLVAALLWLFPMLIAHRLVPRTRFAEKLSVPAQQVTAVATVILGLWLLAARAIPAIAHYAILGVLWSRNGQTLANLPAEQHVALAIGLIDLALALVFMFKAPDIAAYIVSEQAKGEPA